MVCIGNTYNTLFERSSETKHGVSIIIVHVLSVNVFKHYWCVKCSMCFNIVDVLSVHVFQHCLCVKCSCVSTLLVC